MMAAKPGWVGLLAVLPFLGASPCLAGPGDLMKLEKSAEMSRSEIDALKNLWVGQGHYPVPLPAAKNGVRFYKITYETSDLQGAPTLGTGLMILPDAGTGPFPIVSLQHGTMTSRASAPSRIRQGSDPRVQQGDALTGALFYASRGYAVAAADYLGLGDSPFPFHPYCHASSEATSAADLLRALKPAGWSLGAQFAPRLFLVGYSQGGHVTMALHRHLEKDLSGEFAVTASAPMAGPYDLSDTTIKQIILNPSVDSAAELGYIIESMSRAYPQLSSLLETAVGPDMSRQMLQIYEGTHSLWDVVAAMPRTPLELLQPDFALKVFNDRASSFLQALRENDVPSMNDDWKPRAPIRLYHGKADIEVPFGNATVALLRLRALGADAQVINVGDSLDHATGGPPAFEQSRQWFDSLAGIAP